MTQKTRPRKFVFSWKTSLLCGLLASLMLYASYWQWTRHLDKIELIEELNTRLEQPILTQSEFLNSTNWPLLTHRKVKLRGILDYEREVILRNRRYEGTPGFYILTPLKLEDSEDYVIVNRGFIPTNDSDQETRVKFRNLPSPVEFYGLIKNSMHRRSLAPQDPEVGEGHPWLDQWLRVNIPKMQKQLPYKLLPIYLEFISQDSPEIAVDQFVKSDAGKSDMLYLPKRASTLAAEEQTREYPVPQVNTYVPAGRHFGYVFEWGLMALVTLLIGVVAQLRRGKA